MDPPITRRGIRYTAVNQSCGSMKIKVRPSRKIRIRTNMVVFFSSKKAFWNSVVGFRPDLSFFEFRIQICHAAFNTLLIRTQKAQFEKISFHPICLLHTTQFEKNFFMEYQYVHTIELGNSNPSLQGENWVSFLKKKGKRVRF